jgi:hypothetical protein
MSRSPAPFWTGSKPRLRKIDPSEQVLTALNQYEIERRPSIRRFDEAAFELLNELAPPLDAAKSGGTTQPR